MKVFSLVLATLMLASCGGNESSSSSSATPPASMIKKAGADLSSNPVYVKGMELVAKNQCLTCHKIDEKLTGPAYREVAKKYAGANADTVARLAKKIIDGGAGVWGEVPMTPHPNVSMDDAKAMVDYILLLNQ